MTGITKYKQPLGFARVVEREDIGMIQAGGQLNLSKKALAAERFREIGTQDFDRDFAAVLVVVGQVDRGHTARSELAVESILMGERIGQDRRGLHNAVLFQSWHRRLQLTLVLCFIEMPF